MAINLMQADIDKYFIDVDTVRSIQRGREQVAELIRDAYMNGHNFIIIKNDEAVIDAWNWFKYYNDADKELEELGYTVIDLMIENGWNEFAVRVMWGE